MTGPDEMPPVAPEGDGNAPVRPVTPGQPVGAVRNYTHITITTPAPGTAPPSSSPLRTKRRWKPLLIAGAKIAILAALAVLVGLDIRDYLATPAVEASLPQEVHGTWYTGDPKYSSRRFELTARTLVFQVSGVSTVVTRHDILRVQRSKASGGTMFHVEYVDAGEQGEPTMFDFVYRPRPPAEIVFAHQPEVVWMRERATPPKASGVNLDSADEPSLVKPGGAPTMVKPRRVP